MLSPLQVRRLAAVMRYVGTHGYAPTTRECRVMFGHRSTNATRDALGWLEHGGYVRRVATPRARRTLVITAVPVFGDVDAGAQSAGYDGGGTSTTTAGASAQSRSMRGGVIVHAGRVGVASSVCIGGAQGTRPHAEVKGAPRAHAR